MSATQSSQAPIAPAAAFPLSMVIPKDETRASHFLSANPTYDGRGIVVGILDTGVDPGAIGLTTTTDGKPKVIDIIDCTGSGDVCMKHETKADASGRLVGLSGRVLTLGEGWQERNPSGSYRLGVKRAYELWPDGLKPRVKKERKKYHDEKQRVLEVALQRARDKRGGDGGGGGGGGGDGGGDGDGARMRGTSMLAPRMSAAELAERDAAVTAAEDMAAQLDGSGGGFSLRSRRAASTFEDSPNVGVGDSSAEPADSAEVEELVAQLKALQDGYEDPGPLFDCISFQAEAGGEGGEGAATAWVAAVDVTCSGDFRRAKLMAPFGVAQEWASFGEEEQLNFGLQIYDEGAVLSIVTDSGAHGTHVAGITAAHHASCPEQNGVAPGAQIVSFKIGDGRLGGMETGAGLARALSDARRTRVDIINMSFGEQAAVCERGRFIELARELVRDDGVIFVSSAGNAGPAITSVGAPGGTTDVCISVGAYVSDKMMGLQYSVAKPNRAQEQLYSWSSVGPAVDGGHGVEICAPGGAIAPVPNWTLNRHQLMNGTSMSSPNTTGCLTLVLSGLKQRFPAGSAASGSGGMYGGRPWTPYSIRRSMRASAHAPIGEGVGPNGLEPLVYGGGLVQTDACFEHHVAHFAPTPAASAAIPSYVSDANTAAAQAAAAVVAASPAATEGSSDRAAASPIGYDVRFRERHDGTADGAGSRGCYLRNVEEAATPSQQAVMLTPVFHRDEPNGNKVLFERHIALEADAPWLTPPDHVVLMAAGRGFAVSVDPRALPPGVHFGQVRGFDASRPRELGALFEIPFTVVRTESWSRGGADAAAAVPAEEEAAAPAHTHTYALKRFDQGERDRHFLAVPTGATWCDVTVEGAGGVAGGAHAAIDNTNGAAAADGGGGSSSGGGGGSDGAAVASAVNADEDNDARMMLLHCIQLPPQETSVRDCGFKKYFKARGGSSHTFSFRVWGGHTLEVCLAQWWNTVGSALCRLRVSFHGVAVTPNEGITLCGGDGFARVVLRAPLRPVIVKPTAKLTHWEQRLRPASAVVRALGSRDVLPRERLVHELVLEYVVAQKEKGSWTPRLPILNGALYESAFEGQLYMVFDQRKKLLSVGECWPAAEKGPVSVPKAGAADDGKYTLRYQLRHEDRALLERLRDAVCVIERKLEKPVALTFHASRERVADGGAAFREMMLAPGAAVGTFLAEPIKYAPPAGAGAGDSLVGVAHYAKASGDQASGAGQAPGGFPVRYVLPPKAPKAKETPAEAAAKKAKEAAAPPPPTLSEKLRDVQLEALVALEGKFDKPGADDDDEEKAAVGKEVAAAGKPVVTEAARAVNEAGKSYDLLFRKLVLEYPAHLPLLRSRLRHVHALADAAMGGAALDEAGSPLATAKDVIAAADAVLSLLNMTALAAHYGLRTLDASMAELGGGGGAEAVAAATRERDEMDEKKAAAVEALACKSAALAFYSERSSGSAAVDEARDEQLGLAWMALQRWAKVDEPRFGKLALEMLRRGSGGAKPSPRRGLLLKKLTALLDAAPCKLTPKNNQLKLSLTYEQVSALRIAILEELGWVHWAQYKRAWAIVANPRDYALF